ncbi:MAG: NUDIX domain-containing protein [Bacteroidales bacterium]|jgi:ADP-ribose pyrophosphatase YjhB (NUDIX family)|nr:NUDIX domain-containing protein [Bacteroidales bacterium]
MQKYKIFTKHSYILITDKIPNGLKNIDETIIECDKTNVYSINFSNLIDDKKGKKDIIIYVKNIKVEEVFNIFKSNFIFVLAAGGLVKNNNGDYLFIYRNNVWDLPKGHVEKGETIEKAALREVEEECGLRDLILKEKIKETYHTYILNNKRELKQTTWFNMTTNSLELTPQKEEGIEKCLWVKKEDIPLIMKNTYDNIKELFLNPIGK